MRLGRDERPAKLAEFVVDEDAQRLERARRRMDVVRPHAHRRGDDPRERGGGFDRRLGARADDGAGDAARMPLLAEDEDDVGEIALAGVGDDIGGARAFAAHAHVERPVVAEGEAARGGVELHRGDAEIEHDAVDAVEAVGARNRIEIGEAILDQRQPAVRAPLKVVAQSQRAGVAVDADDLAVRGGREWRAYSRRRRRWRRYRCRRHGH